MVALPDITMRSRLSRNCVESQASPAHGHAVRLSGDLVPEHGIENEEHLTHGPATRTTFRGLLRPAQTGVESANSEVVAGSGHLLDSMLGSWISPFNSWVMRGGATQCLFSEIPR